MLSRLVRVRRKAFCCQVLDRPIAIWLVLLCVLLSTGPLTPETSWPRVYGALDP